MKQTRLLILFVCITMGFANTFAGNRYWVGGTSGTWAATTSWSETSGGASGATAPTTGDDVFFESGSAITVTLGADVTVNSITFTSRNVTFAGAFAITTNNMTVTTSQVKFVDVVTVNSAITFSGTNPRITQYTTAYTKLFTMGNGGAFSLTGNSATNYFGGNTSSASTTYAFNTTSALTVYFDPSTTTPLTLGGITVIRGSITLGNNVKTIRATLSDTNSQELILAPDVTFTMAAGGSSTLTASANGGVINASASGSKVIVSTANAGFLDGTKRFFKTGSVINHFEFNSATKIFKLFESVRVRNITKTAGTIETTASKTITVEAGGSITGDGIVGTDVTYESATTRYWVGGSAGSWFNAANWGTSSGNTSTPRIPAYADNVVFDNSAGNANPTVTLTDHVTAADITFTNSNVNFAGAYSTTTNTMTVNSSQVKYVYDVLVNSALTFSGTDPRITQQSTTSGRSFTLGNGGAFTLTDNSATNYFTGNSYAYYTYNTSTPLTVYFNPTTTTAAALVVTKGLITLGNNINTNRITLNATNNQELIVGENATLNITGGGTSNFTDLANGGVINASATGSKVLITSTAPTFLNPGGTKRVFKDVTTINYLEMNSSGQTFVPTFPLTVKNLTLTAGSINNSTNNITIPSGGNLVVAAGTTTAALNASLPSVPTIGIATAGNAQASVAFTSPANGGSLITGYTVTPYVGASAGTPVTANTNPVVVTNLTNGVDYTFTVKANNGVGSSAESTATNPVVRPNALTYIITVSTAKGASELALTPVSDVVVSGDVLTINQATAINSLTVNAGAKVTISGTNALTTTNGITLESNADATATLIDAYETPIINAVVKQHVTAGRNWYMSAPLNNTANVSDINRGASVQYYDESTGSWEIASGTLTRGRGYIQVANASQGTTGTVQFEGIVNSGNVPVTLTNNTAGRGFNLVGNPYPSYLNWSLVATDPVNTHPTIGANMPNSTMWYRTINYNGNSAWEPNKQYVVDNVVYNGTRFYKVTSITGEGYSAASSGPTGGIGTTGIVDNQVTWDYQGSVYVFATVSSNGTPSNASLGSNLIPPMQAFWVKTNTGGGTLTFKNSMRAHEGVSNKLKVPKSQINTMPFVRLSVTNGASADQIAIYVSDNASNDFDSADAPKFFNNSGSYQAEIYTIAGNEKLAINALNNIEEGTTLALGFVTEKDNRFSLKATEVSNLPTNLQLILRDKQTNTEFDLSTGETYHFGSSATNNADRFSLIFLTKGTTTGLETKHQSQAIVYSNAAGQIVIEAPAKSNYAIYNAVGQLIENGVLNTERETRNTKQINGVYVVKVNNQSTRVIIK